MTADRVVAGNVATLDSRRRRRPRRRAEALLEDCMDMLVEALADGFPATMDRIDDALFALADKAESNRLQSAYFEAMRQVRVEREALCTRFAEELRAGIRQRIRCTASPEPEALLDGDVSLSLVDDDALEASLAVGSMARKIRGICREELFGFDRRIGVLLGDRSIEDESNPLGPEVVCDAVSTACQALVVATEVHLLVMKLFEQHLARELESAYGQLNAHLVRHGVLGDPHAARQSARRPGGVAPAGAAAPAGPVPDGTAPSAGAPGAGGVQAGFGVQAGAAPAAGTESVFELVNALLTRQEGFAHPAPAGAAPSGPALTQAQVIAGLTALQHGDAAAGGLTARPLPAAPAPADLRNVVRELSDAGFAGRTSRDDAMVIDVVAMLFDFVLGDEHVCAAIKAQLGRLQIPVLKVAIADRSFFAGKSHPARRYLDALSTLGLELDERDPAAERTLAFVGASIASVVDSPEEDGTLFAEALEALELFLAAERECAVLNAEREAKAAEDAERLCASRARVQEILGERLDGRAIPDAARELLDHYWRELLVQAHFAGGEEDERWTRVIATADELLESIAPGTDQDHRTRMMEALPFLVASLKQGLRQVGAPAEVIDRLLRSLADLHIAALRPETFTEAPRPEAPQPGPADAEQSESDGCVARRSAADPRRVREAIEGASRVVYEAQRADDERAGMGTTVVAAIVRDGKLTVGHVGDSRLYRFRDGSLDALTLDHSMVQELMTKMGIAREEAGELTGSNLLTRAVGTDAQVVPDVRQLDVAAGDLYLACSDGLTDLVEDARIGELLAERRDLSAMADELVAAANVAGGKDNISVILAAVGDDDGDADGNGNGNGEGNGDGGRGRLTMAGASDVGRRRSHNEDAIHVDAARGIMLLADGMGGHNAGEVASAMTVTHVSRILGASVEAPGSSGAAVGEDTLDALSSAFDVDDFEIETIQIGAPDEIEQQEADESLALSESLEHGAWIEFVCEGRATRARLARVSESSGRYLFLDRRGTKVAESTAAALAVELRAGRARLLDDVPLFERTMSSVVGQLRQALAES